jgi:predicted lipoprotein with Yx(FWY)xxD motif
MLSPSRPTAILASAAGLATASTTPAKTTSISRTSVGTTKSALGTILVDSQGRTLYLFTHDSGTPSTCGGRCATAWPPLVVTGAPTATSGANAALLGTSKRADGTTQVTYNGHGLYRFVKDQNAGESNGQGVTAFGGSWFALTVAGNPAGHASSSNSGSRAQHAAATPKPEASKPAPEVAASKAAPEPEAPKPAPEAPPKSARAPEAEPSAEGGIPQNNGGDADPDNNGAPSDGDGSV